MGAFKHFIKEAGSGCCLFASMLLLTSMFCPGSCLPMPDLPHTPGYGMGNSTHYVPCQPKPHQFLRLQMGPAFDNQRMSVSLPGGYNDYEDEEADTRRGRSHRRNRNRREKRHAAPPAQFEWEQDTLPLEYTDSWDSDNEWNSMGSPLRRKRHSDSSGEGRELDTRVMDMVAAGNSSRGGRRQRIRHGRNLATTSPGRRRSRKRASEIAAIIRKPIWQCKMESKWKKMKDGIFPPFIQVGQCTQRTCMYGMYECTPKKYVIKVLKRDTQRCQPIPTLSSSTEYEEVWTFASYKVTVCCDCSRRRRE